MVSQNKVSEADVALSELREGGNKTKINYWIFSEPPLPVTETRFLWTFGKDQISECSRTYVFAKAYFCNKQKYIVADRGWTTSPVCGHIRNYAIGFY